MRRYIGALAVLTLVIPAIQPVPARAQPEGQEFTLTATLSYTANDLHLPLSSRQDVGAFNANSTIKYGDPTHWRVDTTTVAPALLQGSSTSVANGLTLVTDNTLLGRSLTETVTFTAASSIANTLMLGFYRPQATSVTDYVAQRQSRGSHAKIVDQATLLGQPVTVVEMWPVMSGNSSSCTASRGGTSSKCTTRRYSYGETMLWIDSRHLVPLRVQELDMPEGFQQDLTFQVTSIAYGQGPSPHDLEIRSGPAPPSSMPAGCDPSPCGSSVGPQVPWTVPTGFVPVKTPRGWHVKASGETHAPGNDSPVQAVSGVFQPPSAPRTRKLQADISGNYLLIEEQWRANGSPPFFRTGTEREAGTCMVWTGIYSNGTRWLGYTHDNISLLATTNAFSQGRLAHYAAQHICVRDK